MSLDLDEASKNARDTPAFSNGTEGEMWQANWCDRCLRDAPFRNGISATGCPLILIAYCGQTPAEWLEQPDDSPDRYHCIEFKAPGDGGGEPRPKPEPTGMNGLFDRPERQTRMYVQPQPERVAVDS